ncbi:hypothetical protein M3Y97_00027100 [Aphelenchoides bicaudatus]|nr:hypothetical protein M3Y97_00027100 [Aphelenchoides bicaudatus]
MACVLCKVFTCIVFVSLVGSATALTEDYHCGIGPVTKAVSYVISSPCGREELNSCCLQHDRCYDQYKKHGGYFLQICEGPFANCIKNSSHSWICQKFLIWSHCTVTNMFGGLYRFF